MGKGLAFLNSKGKVVMFLDEDVNVKISGELKGKKWIVNIVFVKKV